MKNKRVLEVGSGCGLVGIYVAIQGAAVTLTDMPDVLPILNRNLDLNLKRRNMSGVGGGNNVLNTAVEEYTWGKVYEKGYLSPPYDYIVAADCIYNGDTIDVFVAAVVAMCDTRTTFLFANEVRDLEVNERLMAELELRFRVKIIPRSKLHTGAQNDLILVYEMKLRRAAAGRKGAGEAPDVDAEEKE